jgi:hypothetical protein
VIQGRRLLHELTWRQPGVRTDGNGDEVPDWTPAAVTDATIRGFIQPVGQREVIDGRAAQIGDWLLVTDEEEVDGADRIVWGSRTFEVLGPPAVYTTARGFHHSEAQLREVNG